MKRFEVKSEYGRYVDGVMHYDDGTSGFATLTKEEYEIHKLKEKLLTLVGKMGDKEVETLVEELASESHQEGYNDGYQDGYDTAREDAE